MNRRKLRAIMVLHGENELKLGLAIGMSPKAFYERMNGKRDFRLAELKKIVAHYEMDADQIRDIFFD